jgi:hypothetical protein
MKCRRKEFVEPLNKAQSFGCRVEGWGKSAVRPYVAHNEGAFRQLCNPLQPVQERYNTDLTQVIF